MVIIYTIKQIKARLKLHSDKNNNYILRVDFNASKSFYIKNLHDYAPSVNVFSFSRALPPSF